MNITKATVLCREHHADVVILTTDMPSPTPAVTNQPLQVTFYVEADKGEEYVKNNFNIEPEIIHN